MSVASEISRLQTAKADLKTAIEGKGVTVPSSTKLDGYADLVDSISGGDDWVYVNCNTLIDLTNPGAKAGSRFYAQFTNSSNLIVEFMPPYGTSVNPTPTWTSNKLISTELQPSTDYLIRYRIKPGVNMAVGDVGTLTITNSSGTVTYTFKLVKTFSDTAVLNTQSVDDGADIEKLNVSGGGTEDNYWYMLVGDEYGVDGVRVYECHFKVYFHPNNEQSQWSIYGAAGNISTYYKCIWFEYKGESYYVDNLNDGNHTLSKQGSPIFYQGKFMTVSITKNGNDYIFYCMED